MPRVYTAGDVSQATHRLDLAVTRLVQTLSRKAGMSVAELLALEKISAERSIGPSGVARHLHMTTGAATTLIDRLESSGLVVREPHPKDRRRVVLKRTGRPVSDLVDEGAGIARETLELSEALSGEELQAVGRFLDALITIAERRAAEACASPARSSRGTHALLPRQSDPEGE